MIKILKAIYKFFFWSGPTEVRLDNGNLVRISERGGIRLQMDDPQTKENLRKSREKFFADMRKYQPHMFDENGKFIGGKLK